MTVNDKWRDVRRILLVRLDNLGDVLVTTPAIHAVRSSLPEARISLLTSTVGAQAGGLNPDIDHVITYSAPWMDPWHDLPLDPTREYDMIRQVASHQFDAAIIFVSFRQSPLPAAYLCYLAGIPLRAAASIDGPGSLLTTRHKHPERLMHEVERALDLVGSLGIYTEQTDLVLEVPAEARVAAAERVRATEGPIVVMHPGCSMPARTYPGEMFAEVADLLTQRLGATIFLTGSVEERDLVDRVQNQMECDATNVAGDLSFSELCGLIDVADVTITNNTGPMHIAAAVKTPVVALFALTNPPQEWGPWRVPHRQLFHDVPCRICYQRVCPYEHECLTLVTPQKVLASVASLLAEAPGSHEYREPEPLAVGSGGVVR